MSLTFGKITPRILKTQTAQKVNKIEYDLCQDGEYHPNSAKFYTKDHCLTLTLEVTDDFWHISALIDGKISYVIDEYGATHYAIDPSVFAQYALQPGRSNRCDPATCYGAHEIVFGVAFDGPQEDIQICLTAEQWVPFAHAVSIANSWELADMKQRSSWVVQATCRRLQTHHFNLKVYRNWKKEPSEYLLKEISAETATLRELGFNKEQLAAVASHGPGANVKPEVLEELLEILA